MQERKKENWGGRDRKKERNHERRNEEKNRIKINNEKQ